MTSRTQAIAEAPYHDAQLLPVDLAVDRRRDGTILITSRIPLAEHDWNLPRVLASIAATRPEAPALSRRAGGTGDWQTTHYGELKRQCDAVSQWLLDHPTPGPVLMMGANSVAMAAFIFGTMAIGVPSAPVSPQLALMGGDLARLRHVLKLLKPTVLFVEDARPLAAGLNAVELGHVTIITGTPEVFTRPTVSLAEVLATPVTAAVAASIDALTAAGTVQFLLTSGSTGLPKAVPTSLANVAANNAANLQLSGLEWTSEMLNWMPWHHAAGAGILRAVLLTGGHMYLDDGKPVPGLFDLSVRNLKERPVRYYVNVPAGFALLVDALEADPAFQAIFFSELRLMLYGGAALSQALSDRLQRMAIAQTGHRILMISAYGATETTSGFMAIYDYTETVGLGLPLPGPTIKLVPDGERYELRVRGATVTRGYHDDPERSAAAFDEEGFYRTGDLTRFIDPENPDRGLAFAGRMAEEFKLATGAWVSGGEMREAALRALSPLVTEVVLADDNRPCLCVLVWPSADGVRAETGLPLEEAIGSGALAAALQARLDAHNRSVSGASRRIERLSLLLTPPDPNAHEVSDKGSINRRAVLDRRHAEVERLYETPVPPGVVATTV
ncbi:MAG: AMP-binding protein [Caulobacteraceae bacterium]|nr:AMP-binding protein [Caulobacteraceae bacterium]